MDILITGIAGFAASHFLDMLATTGEQHKVTGFYHQKLPSFAATHYGNIEMNFVKVNLLDAAAVENNLLETRPSNILHLASISSVSASWKNPGATVMDNTGMFVNLMEAVRKNDIHCRVLSVGSTEEYGTTAAIDGVYNETLCPMPASPYGAARVMQQKLSTIYARNYNLDVIHTRSFNHIGTNQKPEFVISSFAKQVAEQLIDNPKEIVLHVGDVNVIRDFTDVKDVVKAYYELLQHGMAGETYNVCSGMGYKLSDVITMFSVAAGVPVRFEIDKERFRPAENKKVVGTYKKLHDCTGWDPKIPLQETLRDMLEWWKGEVGKN